MSEITARLLGGEIGSFRVSAGETITVTNTFGGQVVDAWFFVSDDMGEFASMSHSRASMRTIRPAVGHTFVTCCRKPLVTIVADTSTGTHDMTNPPCDMYRYEQLGAPGHRNCADNLRSALHALGHPGLAMLPDPLNLFQNSPIDAEGHLAYLESPATAGSHISLLAERGLVAFLSVCPMDIMPINGGTAREIDVEVHRHDGSE